MSALAQPKWPQHRILPLKAAALHFALNKNHAYIDGNKRLALVATETFLIINHGALIATDEELQALALGVAANEISREQNRAFFAERCARTTWSKDKTRRWLRQRQGLDSGLAFEREFERFQRVTGALWATVASAMQETRGKP